MMIASSSSQRLNHGLCLAILFTLAGCSSAPPRSSLLALSTKNTGCAPAERLQLSGYRPAAPRDNEPEQWNVTGCDRSYNCSSYLLSTGGRALTKCLETDDSVARRLKRESVDQVSRRAKCPKVGVEIKGKMARDKGATQIFLLEVCKRSFRCVTEGVRQDNEAPTRCEELKAKK